MCVRAALCVVSGADIACVGVQSFSRPVSCRSGDSISMTCMLRHILRRSIDLPKGQSPPMSFLSQSIVQCSFTCRVLGIRS